MHKKTSKINIFIFFLMLFVGSFLSFQIAFASECEDIYGGTCSVNKNCAVSAEIPLDTAGGKYGCSSDEYCCVLQCNSNEIKKNIGEAICAKKSNCSKQLDYSLDCVSKIGSDGVCCTETKTSSSSSTTCVPDNDTLYDQGECQSGSSCSGSYSMHVSEYDSNCDSGKICCSVLKITYSQTSSSSSSSGIVPCGGESDPCTLCHLIIGIWNLIEWGKNILVTVAIVAIFISGIMYTVSTGSEKMITQAKDFLTASLVGFAITLAAWLIVDVTITWVANADPQLGIGKSSWHTFTCDTASSALTGSGTTSGGAITTSTGTGTDAALRKILTDAGFSIKSSGNCSDRNNSRCTSLDGMENNAINEIIAVKNTCGINTITGANETGHSSHNGLTFDVEASSTQAQCVYNNSSQLNVAQLCTDSANSRLRKNCDGYNEPNGILHIRFNN
ncbi:MAG TPA: pilin [Candidatus Moranbacteria bacterium]|nr:pilin [Candidatus Moranbacteria bacterium]